MYIVNSTFGGQAGLGNASLQGGALSSTAASFTVLNSVLSYNEATTTDHKGRDGAIFLQGANDLTLCGTQLTDNLANASGGAIFFSGLENDSDLSIRSSILRNNKNNAEAPGYPGIFVSGANITVESSFLE